MTFFFCFYMISDDCFNTGQKRLRLTNWLVYVCSEKLEQLGLTPIDEVTEDDEEDNDEEIEEEEDDEEIGGCENDGSEMEFKVPQSHQSSASLQSLSSEGSSSCTEVETSDADASASAKRRESGQDWEENTHNSRGNKKKSFCVSLSP